MPDVSSRGCNDYCKSALLFNHHLLLYETLGEWEMSGKNRYERRELCDKDKERAGVFFSEGICGQFDLFAMAFLATAHRKAPVRRQFA